VPLTAVISPTEYVAVDPDIDVTTPVLIYALVLYKFALLIVVGFNVVIVEVVELNVAIVPIPL